MNRQITITRGGRSWEETSTQSCYNVSKIPGFQQNYKACKEIGNRIVWPVHEKIEGNRNCCDSNQKSVLSGKKLEVAIINMFTELKLWIKK